VIDFDQIGVWHPQLRVALSNIVSDDTCAAIRSAKPEFVEDACKILFERAGRDPVIDVTLAWLQSSTVAGYHGTRLTDDDLASVKAAGLLPLVAAQRKTRIVRALSQHADWQTVSKGLDDALEKFGSGWSAGRREGQAHLTLSRAGLVQGFNHYLTHGSEFDGHVAYTLLGELGKDLLMQDGQQRVIQFEVPGRHALKASHPHFSIEDMRARGNIPNIVREFLRAWSYRVAYPDFDSRSLEVDCGMIFREPVPAGWIRKIETLSD
jgi:hypothetical protein